MAFAPAPLPHLSLLFDAVDAPASIGAPVPLPHLSLVLGASATYLPGTFSVAGQDATLKAGRKLVAAGGTYSLSGQDATLTKATPSAGLDNPAPLPHLSLVLTGNSTYKFVAANVGTITVTGQDATLRKGRGLVAETGYFTVSGAPALADYELDCEAGLFNLSGRDAAPKVDRTLVAATGTFTMSGYLSSGRYEQPGAKTLPGQVGALTVTGYPAVLLRGYTLEAEHGTFTLVGGPADLDAPLWQDTDNATSVWTPVTPSGGAWTQA